MSAATPLELAWQRARDLGKPLLVILVPPYARRHWHASELFGALLDRGTDETLATLALTEIVCATPEETQARLGFACTPDDLFALFDAATAPPTVIATRLWSVPLVPEASFARTRLERVDFELEDDAVLRRDVERLAAVLCHTLVQAPHALESRVSAANASLPSHVIASFVSSRPDALALPDLVDAAALAHAAAADCMVGDDAARTEWIARLASGARMRWVVAAPAGARWASAGGCGDTRVDGFPASEQVRSGMVCGTASLSDFGRRFLWFYGSPRELEERERAAAEFRSEG